jgi:leucyl-tRNA synthetase
VRVSEGRLDAPGGYDFGEVEAHWRGLWDYERVSNEAGQADPSPGAYYVLQSPPYPRDNPPPGQLKSEAFAGALAQYHRLRGRRVLTDGPAPIFDDLQAPDWPEHVKTLQRSMIGRCDGIELIFGCTEIDEARVLTKTLARMGTMMAKEPYMRALALGIITRDGHTPMISTEPYVKRYGADTVRCYMIFMGPHEHDLPWSDGQIGGMHRFLSRLWGFAQGLAPHFDIQPGSPVGANLELLRKTHETIDHVTNTMETDRRFHLAIAAIMQLVNEAIHLRDRVQPGTIRFAIQAAASLLFPFAPYCAADVCHRLTGERVWETPWPAADPAFLIADEREIIVQVDGKVRDRVRVKCDISRDELTDLARRSAHAQEHIQGHEISREVVVPGKLVNFVTR